MTEKLHIDAFTVRGRALGSITLEREGLWSDKNITGAAVTFQKRISEQYDIPIEQVVVNPWPTASQLCVYEARRIVRGESEELPF